MTNALRRLENPHRSVTVFEDDLTKLRAVAWAAIRLRAGHVPPDLAAQELDLAIERLQKEAP